MTAKKADPDKTERDALMARAKELEIELDANETIADLKAKIFKAEVVKGPGVYVLDDEGNLRRLDPGSYNVTQVEGGAEIGLSGSGQLEGELTRRKVNRGSRRRIERALTDLNKALDAAVAEFDMQAFMADDEGNRIGDWPAVTELRQAKERVNERVNALFAQD